MADRARGRADDSTAERGGHGGTLTIGETDCFIPQIVYSTTFGYRTDAFKGRQPSPSPTCST